MSTTVYKKELGWETFLFPLVFAAFFALFAFRMGLANTINTMMNTAYRLLIDTVLYITAGVLYPRQIEVERSKS